MKMLRRACDGGCGRVLRRAQAIVQSFERTCVGDAPERAGAGASTDDGGDGATRGKLSAMGLLWRLMVGMQPGCFLYSFGTGWLFL